MIQSLIHVLYCCCTPDMLGCSVAGRWWGEVPQWPPSLHVRAGWLSRPGRDGPSYHQADWSVRGTGLLVYSTIQGFNMHIQSKLLQQTFVVALVLIWVSPFVQNKSWVGRRVGYLATTFVLKEHTTQYNCDSENTKLGYWICNASLRRINSKIEICALWIFLKVIVVLILNGCFRNIKGNRLRNFRE